MYVLHLRQLRGRRLLLLLLLRRCDCLLLLRLRGRGACVDGLLLRCKELFLHALQLGHEFFLQRLLLFLLLCEQLL